jgi:hypothetical protein
MPPPLVCLLDGESPLTPAALHLLAQRDVQVIVGHSEQADADRVRHLGPCGHTHAYPDPHDPAADFAGEILAWLHRERPDVVLPLGLPCTLALAPASEELAAQGIALVAPPRAPLEAVLGRSALWSTARSAGLAVPHAITIEHGDARSALRRFAGLPAVAAADIAAPLPARLPATEDEALADAAEIQRRTGKAPLLVETIPPGRGWIAVTALCDAPGGVMACVAEAWTGWDAAAGQPRWRAVVEAPRAVEAALSLVRTLAWSGPATALFAIDPRDGWPKLLQVWPGLTRGLALAAAAGIDLVWPLVEWALEHTPTIPERYRTDVATRWRPDGAAWLFIPPAGQGDFEGRPQAEVIEDPERL